MFWLEICFQVQAMARCRLIIAGAGARRWKQERFWFGAILGCIQSLSKMEQMTKVYRMSVSRSPGAPVAGHWKYLMIVCGWMPSVAINLGRGRAPAQLRHKCPRYWKRSKLRHQSTAAAAIKMIGQYNFKRRFAKISQSRRKPLLGPPSWNHLC